MKIEIKFEAELPKDQRKINALLLSDRLVKNYYLILNAICDRDNIQDITEDEKEFLKYLLNLIHENGQINELL